MKKYFIKTSMLILMLTFTFACNQDILEIPQKGVIEFDKYYENAGPAEAEQLMASVYYLYYAQLTYITTQYFLDVLSDDNEAGGNAFSDQASGFNVATAYIMTSTQENPVHMYTQAYRLIYWANCIIEKIPATTDARINRVKAEANFMRALAMFELVRWFGTPPFVDNLTTALEQHNLPNGDHAVIIPWVLARMKESADALPALSGMGTQRAFGARLSKHAVLAYMGKVALWYGTRYKNPTILAQAVEPLKTVVNSGLYGLLDDMFMLDRPAADFSKEYIFERNAADATSHPNDQSDNRHQWSNWRNQLMNLPAELWNGGWQWNPPSGDFGRFLEKHEGGIEKPRFKSTLRTLDQVMAMTYNSNAPARIIAPIAANEGYFRYRKLWFFDDVYQEVPGTLTSTKKSKANEVYMRYAEVLLMYAEAQFLVNGDADGSGLKALNEVRRRAQIPELTSMTYQDIKDERRAELWSRGERFHDLVRWGDAATALKDKGKNRWTLNVGNGKGYNADGTWAITRQDGPGSGWDPKYELMPFPNSQLLANPNLKQNPGW